MRASWHLACSLVSAGCDDASPGETSAADIGEPPLALDGGVTWASLLDGVAAARQVIYLALVDRFSNGDPANDDLGSRRRSIRASAPPPI
jgi:hypothetical protein